MGALVLGFSITGGSASAGPLTVLQQYNLITLDDAYTTSHVDFNALVGGDLKGSGAVFAMHSHAIPGSPSTVGLSVVGDVHGQNKEEYKVLSGKKAAIGGIYRLPNGTPTSQQLVGASEVIQPALGLDSLRDAIKQDLAVYTAGYAAMDVTSAVDVKSGNTKVFKAVANNDGVAVFEITAALLEDTQYTEFELERNGARSIVINVRGKGSGDVININKGFNGSEWNSMLTRSTTIFNFIDATAIDIEKQFNGAILADSSLLTVKAVVQGSVFVNSLYQVEEIHQPYFNGFVPPPVTAVPEPSTLALGAMAVAGLSMWSVRRRAQGRA